MTIRPVLVLLLSLLSFIAAAKPSTIAINRDPLARATTPKNYLRAKEWLGPGDYLVSSNKAFFAALQPDGTFCVGKGESPGKSLGKLWCMSWERKDPGPKPPVPSGYSLDHQSNGDICLHLGELQWRSKCRVSTPWGEGYYFTVLQNDGSLVTYQGKVGDTRKPIWNSGFTAVVNWLPGKKIVSARYSQPMYWGVLSNLWDAKAVNRMWLRTDNQNQVPQKFVLMVDDATLRWEQDGRQCVTLRKPAQLFYAGDGTADVIMAPCNNSSAQTGWKHAADGRLTNASTPKGCLAAHDINSGWTAPFFDDACWGGASNIANVWRLE